jgi:acetoin utilization deacetylase AcuC-like enzyme
LYVAYAPLYAHPLPEGHRFPMAKYEWIPQQLLLEGVLSADDLHAPDICPDEVAAWVHDTEYLQKLKGLQLDEREQRRIGFPQSALLVEREFRIVQGTINACEAALTSGIGLNVAGGTHHAFRDRGEGFCLLNDFAVASAWLLRNGFASRILIVDLDVHQGNGTASIFRGVDRVYTFSMHGQHNYPFHKETGDRDVPLRNGIGDDEYMGLLREHLQDILRAFSPDFVCYLSGVDVLSTDKFGKLNLSRAACRERDRIVFTTFRERKVPVAVAMGGGYSPDLRTIVDTHCDTFRIAHELYC